MLETGAGVSMQGEGRQLWNSADTSCGIRVVCAEELDLVHQVQKRTGDAGAVVGAFPVVRYHRIMEYLGL